MRDNAFEAVNGTAAASLVAATIWGMTLQEWAAALACVYTMILLGEKGWRFVQQWRAKS